MKPWPKFTLIVLYGGYLYVLLKIILFKFGPVDASLLMKQLARAMQHPEMMQNRLEFANLTPFVTIRQNIHRISDLHHMINLLGNVVIFMPNGIFMGLLTKGKALGALIASFAVSLALECSQLLFSMGSFDVDDLILNSFGGLLGYFGYWLMLQLFTDPSSNQGTVRASNRPAT